MLVEHAALSRGLHLRATERARNPHTRSCSCTIQIVSQREIGRDYTKAIAFELFESVVSGGAASYIWA